MWEKKTFPEAPQKSYQGSAQRKPRKDTELREQYMTCSKIVTHQTKKLMLLELKVSISITSDKY